MFNCKKCNSLKPEEEWYYSVNGRDSMCKSCRKEYRKNEKKDYQKLYYDKNKQYYRDLNKEFFKNNPNYRKNWKKISPEKYMLRNVKSRAKKMGIEFNLELSDIIIPDLCPVFKVPMIHGTKTAPSLDRINPKKGYVKGNVKVISRRANVIKNDGSIKEHQAIIEYLLENM